MSNIQRFQYNSNQIRTIHQEGQIWFCLKDVCVVLGLSNATMVMSRLDKDELTKLNLGGRSGITIFVNESGLYAVILRSDKPNAKPFRKWVTSEVLPAIRKTGQYSVNNTECSHLCRFRPVLEGVWTDGEKKYVSRASLEFAIGYLKGKFDDLYMRRDALDKFKHLAIDIPTFGGQVYDERELSKALLVDLFGVLDSNPFDPVKNWARRHV